jgi:hypothetical protein
MIWKKREKDDTNILVIYGRTNRNNPSLINQLLTPSIEDVTSYKQRTIPSTNRTMFILLIIRKYLFHRI